jgi:hypothetical protein
MENVIFLDAMKKSMSQYLTFMTNDEKSTSMKWLRWAYLMI